MSLNQRLAEELARLDSTGNRRRLPAETSADIVDLSSNDYLGLASRQYLVDEFYAVTDPAALALTSAASRLLSSTQRVYRDLEHTLSSLYGREALLFNSGYHANTGIVSALADKHTLILADKLVHASIIDGIKLSGADFTRFRHNDFTHLQSLVEGHHRDYDTLLVIVESVYSMDGDRADIEAVVSLKSRYDNIVIYVDEAHSFGVIGPGGLGLVVESGCLDKVDIVVGTLGKAAASSGAFVICSDLMRDYLVNKARSLIFSTAIAPVNAAWSRFVVERMVAMDTERQRLKWLSARVAEAIGSDRQSHILPYVVGSADAAVALSGGLLDRGVKVLPIRTPTVPPGTERLRLSLSAAITDSQLDNIILPAFNILHNAPWLSKR